jgi:hypothetical protein
MDRQELLERLTQDVLAYVMHGGFPEDRLASDIKPEGLDERFDDYESLIRLHFVLRPDVVDFVEALPQRLRNVKTQTKHTTRTTRGRIDGRVDWSATIRRRHSTNPRDTSLFVCQNRSESYDIDENVVLKQLPSVIYTTLKDCEQYLRREYEWVTDRWRENLELVDTMIDLFERNVHVTRIRNPKEYEPTERMLQRAAESREPVYREAVDLLRTYRSSLAGEEDAIRELLNETAITPNDEETLLELFVLFRFIETIEEVEDEEFRLRTIESGSQEVARMEGEDAEIVLYHDSSANDRGLRFAPSEPDKDRSDLTRAEMVKREAREVTAEYFGTDVSSVWTKRPDVIVLEVAGDERTEYLITEIKNSTRKETIQQGIEETLEYLAFLQQDREFVYQKDTDYFGAGWNGLLVIQDVKGETRDLRDQRSIRILQAAEVEDRLEEILRNVAL